MDKHYKIIFLILKFLIFKKIRFLLKVRFYLVSFVLCYIEAISNVSRVGPRDKFITSKSENRGYSMKVRHFLFLLRINKKCLSLTCFTKLFLIRPFPLCHLSM